MTKNETPQMQKQPANVESQWVTIPNGLLKRLGAQGVEATFINGAPMARVSGFDYSFGAGLTALPVDVAFGQLARAVESGWRIPAAGGARVKTATLDVVAVGPVRYIRALVTYQATKAGNAPTPTVSCAPHWEHKA